MCGVFGFIAKGDNGPDPRRLERIARATETRGRHAFGFAWVDSVGRLKMFKQTGRISDHLGLLTLAADARMLIGHCRFATDGDPRYNINNHPHAADGGWLVHNGVIPQYDRLVKQYELNPISHCDSEVLGLLIETLEGPMVDRVVEACETATRNGLVMLGLWKNPAQLIALRAGNPLYLGETKKSWYLGSLPDALPDPFMVRNHSVLEFTAVGSKVEMVAYDATPAETL